MVNKCIARIVIFLKSTYDYFFMSKVSIIGAGNVGASAVLAIAKKNLADVVMVDIAEDLAKGKALDMMHSLAAMGVDADIKGTGDYADIKDSDIVIVTAGIPRKPGMTREDLVDTNKKIMTSVCENIKKHAPDSIVIIVANPMDLMTAVAYKVLGFKKERVMGMGGALDSARMCYQIKQMVGKNYSKIVPMVIGMHGEKMVPAPDLSTVDGGKLIDVLNAGEIDQIIEKTKGSGAEIVKFFKTGSAYYAPGEAIRTMVESILTDKKIVVPSCVLLDGEYGYKDVFIGVPVELGKNGVSKIVEMDLSDDTEKKFDDAVLAMKELMEKNL